MPMIKKILVANRGEIALRVMRTAKDLGITTVAIYSEADRLSPHVKYADEAYFVGPPPSASSYLSGDKIIEICKLSNTDAVHPGYGFLSENAEFARKVTDNGLIFIGPSPEAIETMGDKLAAKAAVSNFDVPMVPGTPGAIDDPDEALKMADEIGYPVLIKASAGGGGKGMRVVNSESELREQMQMAISEAKSAFGDGSVFIEKYITSPKHIEIQILGDQHGQVIYLFERECSIQRRHQKVIEEAPSCILSNEMRSAMCQAAIGVAKACNYYGAGTVEFIVDENQDFYFLEMNTRLQVEHPVTEEITGIDLVKEQIRIAEGKPLEIKQESLNINGHAIEVRVYAEDPANNFLPDIGTLETYNRPQGPGIRVDDGFEEGMKIPIYYDPMIAKLITYGENREEALNRMLRAIDDYEITGIKTTLPFCRFVLTHDSFKSGKFDTNFVQNFFNPDVLENKNNPELEELAAVFAGLMMHKEKYKPAKGCGNLSNTSKWRHRLK